MAKRISRRLRKLAAPRGFEILPSDGRRFMVLRLRSGRRVVQRTFTSSEVDFLVWMLAWVSWNSDEAKTPGQALLLAFERGRGISPVGELSRRAQVPPLHGLSPAAVAACTARWFSAAGSHIAFPACPTDVAMEEGSAKAGFLAAAMELRDLLAQCADGRKALRDLGFEPTCGGEGRGT